MKFIHPIGESERTCKNTLNIQKYRLLVDWIALSFTDSGNCFIHSMLSFFILRKSDAPSNLLFPTLRRLLALYDTGNSPNNPPLNLRGGLPKTESPPTHLYLVPGDTSVKHSIHPYASRTFRNGFHRPFA